MSNQSRCKLGNLYRESEVVILEEKSMVSNKTLLNIHKWLCEFFVCSEANLFAGKNVIFSGNLLQLPPVKSQQIFAPLEYLFERMCNPWCNFSICELSEVIQQQGDKKSLTLLISVRIGNMLDTDVKLLHTMRFLPAT